MNVGVLVAPVIPAITDHELQQVLAAVAEAGARHAGNVILRLPHELKVLFREWLQRHYPARAAHVMSIIQSLRGGQGNDPRFGSRMARNGLARGAMSPLPTTLFRAPPGYSGPMDLAL